MNFIVPKLIVFSFQDKKGDLLINTYVDDVLVKVMKKLGLEIPEYTKEMDPTKQKDDSLEWTIMKAHISEVKKLYNLYCKGYKKRKRDEMKQLDSESDKKICKEEHKENENHKESDKNIANEESVNVLVNSD